MAVSFLADRTGRAPRLVGIKLVTKDLDKEELLARIRELESLCTEVLVAGVDLGLPQRLLNQLWGAVGHGECLTPSTSICRRRRRADRSAARGTRSCRTTRSGFVGRGPRADGNSRHPVDHQSVDVRERRLAAEAAAGRAETDRREEDRARGRRRSDDARRVVPHPAARELPAADGERRPGNHPEAAADPGDVDLLVTDYAMPDMQGRELADHVRQRFPAVKVLYQTGFSDMLFENRAELEEGAAFLEKPFTARGLREAARLVLFGSINP